MWNFWGGLFGKVGKVCGDVFDVFVGQILCLCYYCWMGVFVVLVVVQCIDDVLFVLVGDVWYWIIWVGVGIVFYVVVIVVGVDEFVFGGFVVFGVCVVDGEEGGGCGKVKQLQLSY